MPLSQLNTLKAGELVRLLQNAAAQAQLVDHSGQTSRAVNPRQRHGMRAVRLVYSDADEIMVQETQAIETLHPKTQMPEDIAPASADPVPNPSAKGDELDALLATSSS